MGTGTKKREKQSGKRMETATDFQEMNMERSDPEGNTMSSDGCGHPVLDVEQLSSLQWHYIHRRIRTPWYTYLLWEGVSKHHYGKLSFPYEMKDVLYVDGEIAFAESVWVAVERAVFSVLEEDPDFILGLFREAYSLDEEILGFVKPLSIHDFSATDSSELADILDRYVALTVSASAFMIFPLFMERILEDRISASVRDRFKEESDVVMQMLTTSVRPSSTQEEEIALLELSSRYARGEDIGGDISKHIEMFGWLSNAALDGSYFSEKDVLDRISVVVEKHPEDTLAEMLRERKRVKVTVARYREMLRKDIASAIDTLQEAIYFRSWRTERFYRNIQYLRGLLETIAERIGCDPSGGIYYLLPIEVSALLRSGSRCDMTLIDERRKGYVLYGDGERTEAYSGPIVGIARERIDVTGIGVVKDSELTGKTAYPGRVSGPACVIRNTEDFSKMRDGDVLVSHSTTPDYVPVIRRAIAIVTDEGGVLSHASVISREMRIPCVIGTKSASKVVHDGDMVEVDADSGVVKIL